MWALFKKITDRRSEARFDVSLTTKMLIDGHPHLADTIDISTSGAKLFIDGYDREFKPDECFRFEFSLPSDQRPLHITGRVVKVTPKGNFKNYLHIQFEAMGSEDRMRIAELQKIVSNPIEKRNEMRLFSCVEARIFIKGQSVEAYSKDISASGIRLQFRAPYKFTSGEKYKVEIDIPGKRGTIVSSCTVIRVDQQDTVHDNRTIALRFIDMPSHEQHQIRKFVEKRKTERNTFGIR